MSAHHLGVPLARGRTSAIYAWENGKVLKVFHAWFPADDVKYEARIARSVHSSGLRVPAVSDIEAFTPVSISGRVYYLLTIPASEWKGIETEDFRIAS